jgi:probable DNA repair protein
MKVSTLQLQDLLARLENGALVLTVNKRLARYLRQAYDRRQQNEGRSAWRSPSVFSCGAWQRQLAGRLGLDDGILDNDQALRLWERAIEEDLKISGDGLLRVPDAANEAFKAHRLLCEYGIDFRSEEGGEDHRTFLRWRQRWRDLCRMGGWEDPTLLSDRLQVALQANRIRLPTEVWFGGFDDLSPSIVALSQTLQSLGVTVQRWMPPDCPAPNAGRVPLADAEEEVRHCARWVRRLLEKRIERIGIIAVDMAAYQERLQRIFREELTPSALLPGTTAAKAFNLSLGSPLLKEGMVTAAFELLSLGRTVSLDRLSYLLRSPFVWGHLSEQHARAVFDRELRNLRMAELPLKQVIRFARNGFKKNLGRADIMARLLETVLSADKQGGSQLPGAWARGFAKILDACQWPGDRGLDSREYQVFSAWKELLAGMGRFDAVCEPMTKNEALSLLRRLAAEAVFQPEGSEGRVQVLGALEAAGQQFDAVWLLGAHDEALPAPARPHPFIPLTLQRRYKMPHADADRELDFAHKVIRRLLTSAPDLVVSWPENQDGRERQPSPLIHHLPLIEPERADSLRPALLIQACAANLETLVDSTGPSIQADTRVSGGTAILKDQALCPFRAYARHRLGAWGLASGSLGFDGLDRGSLVHRVLEWFWEKTGNWQALSALDPESLDNLLARYIERALDEHEARRGFPLSRSQRFLESHRLLELMREWFSVEAKRPPFEVETLEIWHRARIGALSLQTRIDRIDRLADGSQVIIDYKTGLAAVGDWLGERPVEPQLPLYAFGRRDSDLAAVAFGRVRRGDCGFVGIGCRNDLVPGIAGAADHRRLGESEIADWAELLRYWRCTLQKLGDDFSGGHAVVDPVNSRQACERCDLHSLCRIAEQDDMTEDDILI